MTSLLVFLGCLVAIAAIGWTVSRITGARAVFLDDWPMEPGEAFLWRDDRADVVTVPILGRSVMMGGLRLHRSPVAVTSSRILLAAKTARGRPMVMRQLLPDPPAQAAPDLARLGGGLLTRGFETVAIEPRAESRDRYVALRAMRRFASSANLSEFRVYSDDLAGFLDAAGRIGVKNSSPAVTPAEARNRK